jgi:hypothetical protein
VANSKESIQNGWTSGVLNSQEAAVEVGTSEVAGLKQYVNTWTSIASKASILSFRTYLGNNPTPTKGDQYQQPVI